MMDEGIAADEEIVSRLQNAQGVIVILEIPGTEPFIEKADLFKHFPLEKIAESHERRPLFPKRRI